MKVWLAILFLLLLNVVRCSYRAPHEAHLVQAAADSSHFCPLLAPPEDRQKTEFIQSGDVLSLLRKLSAASPNTTLLLADGVYALAPNQSLEINTPRVTLRSASGSRDAVIIEGGYNNVSINTDDVTVADLTLRQPKFHNIQVRGEKGLQGTKIYNVHLVDAGQQFVKVGYPRKAGHPTLSTTSRHDLIALPRSRQVFDLR